MFISPNIAIDNQWIKFPDWMSDQQKQKCIQPNAIDFTVDRLFTIDDQKTFRIDEDNKTMRGGEELFPVQQYWILHTESYDAMSDFYIEVPDGVAAYMIVRSTFNRNGLFITSGLYDSGFCGNVGFVIHNNSGTAHIKPRTRIGQLIFVDSDSVGSYAGGYNAQQGFHWTETTDVKQ